MGLRIAVLSVLLLLQLEACASRATHCDGGLEPINVSMPAQKAAPQRPVADTGSP